MKSQSYQVARLNVVLEIGSILITVLDRPSYFRYSDDDSFDDSNDDYTDYEDYDDDIYGDGIYDDDIYEFQFGGVDREDRDAEYYMAMERAFNF